MLDGFKKFLLRGNVVDLAVGVVIGGAFGKVVESLVKDLLTPFIGAIAMIPDFSGYVVTINKSPFGIGAFINAIISFLLVAAAIYFAVVVPMNKITAKMKKEAPKDPTEKPCKECMSMININAKRCAFCTSPQV